MRSDYKAGYELLSQAVGLDIKVVENDVMEMRESVAQRLVLQLDEDELETSTFGFIFAIAVQSFADAAPRGLSEREYVKDDEFSLGDLLLHLRFVRGEVHLATDYLRGRMMKTDVEARNGWVRITTRNRGEAASRWVMRLQGKQILRPIEPPSHE
jgi:hypothetical protein